MRNMYLVEYNERPSSSDCIRRLNIRTSDCAQCHECRTRVAFVEDFHFIAWPRPKGIFNRVFIVKVSDDEYYSEKLLGSGIYPGVKRISARIHLLLCFLSNLLAMFSLSFLSQAASRVFTGYDFVMFSLG